MIEVITAIALMCQGANWSREWQERCQKEYFNCVYKDLGKLQPSQLLTDCTNKILNKNN